MIKTWLRECKDCIHCDDNGNCEYYDGILVTCRSYKINECIKWNKFCHYFDLKNDDAQYVEGVVDSLSTPCNGCCHDDLEKDLFEYFCSRSSKYLKD